MTPEQLEQQSREAVIAYLQDSIVQLEYLEKHKCDLWIKKDRDARDVFDFRYFYYRIAQPKPWYRVALIKSESGNYVETAENIRHEEFLSNHEGFLKWLTDRITYEN